MVLIMLFFNGNPLTNFLFGKFSALACLMLVIIIGYKEFIINNNYIRLIRNVFLFLFLLTILQLFYLDFVSILAMTNLFIKILIGGIVIYSCKDKLPKILFDLVAILSAISILFFLNSALSIIEIPSIKIGENINSNIIYTQLDNQEEIRNSGMFWEPGAFAGIITLVLALNYKRIQNILRYEKIKITILFLALLTTQSTTGYIVFFIILIFYFVKPKYFILSAISIPIIVISFLYVFNTNEFLSEKFTSQYEKTEYQEIGDFSNTRFGSLIFDWYYIQKHPFIGNGFDIRSRYADHQYLFGNSEVDVIGSGNSFSNYFASMGVFFIFGYFFLLLKATVQIGRLFALLIFTIVLLNLQGEQWFNYPLYLGLPFLLYGASKQRVLMKA